MRTFRAGIKIVLNLSIIRAQIYNAPVVSIGSLIFFFTKTGDGWMVDCGEGIALCLAKGVDEQPHRIIETAEKFAIEWNSSLSHWWGGTRRPMLQPQVLRIHPKFSIEHNPTQKSSHSTTLFWCSEEGGAEVRGGLLQHIVEGPGFWEVSTTCHNLKYHKNEYL